MPGRISIIGLGPGDPSLRTIGAQSTLNDAESIILRTGIHPGVDDLLADSRVSTCDDLYQTQSSFEAVYAAVANRVIEAALTCDVVYAVPGHPLFGERTVQHIFDLAEARGIDVEVQAAVSTLDSIASSTGIDPLADEIQIIDAETLDSIWEHEPFSGGWLVIDPTRPSLVTQVYSQLVASHAKLTLTRFYPEDHEILVIRGAGVPGQEDIVACRLFELDHQSVDHLTSVLIPPLDDFETFRTAEAVQRLVAHLRSPEGCPWDRKQNHESLRAAVIEEAYEVVDAIDEDDTDHLAEELGDLLLLIAMHAQIADEAGNFSLENVFEHISTKLIRRHPHVFGEVEASSPEDVVATWESVKKTERETKGGAATELHPFDRLPKSMPVLTRVATTLKKELPSQPATLVDRQRLASKLFDAIEALVAAGLEPEQELLAFARRRIEPELVGSTQEIDIQES